MNTLDSREAKLLLFASRLPWFERTVMKGKLNLWMYPFVLMHECRACVRISIRFALHRVAWLISSLTELILDKDKATYDILAEYEVSLVFCALLHHTRLYTKSKGDAERLKEKLVTKVVEATGTFLCLEYAPFLFRRSSFSEFVSRSLGARLRRCSCRGEREVGVAFPTSKHGNLQVGKRLAQQGGSRKHCPT
jgi:hypothetical protein